MRSSPRPDLPGRHGCPSPDGTNPVRAGAAANTRNAACPDPDRTLMWMQPAPAQHRGPMRKGLREPVGINPLCRVASHALFGPWITRRIATRRRTDGLYQNGPKAQVESSKTPENIASSRGPAALPPGEIGRLILPPGNPGGANPSHGSRPQTHRIKSNALANGGHAGRGQVIRSRGSGPVRPEASHRSISQHTSNGNPQIPDLKILTERLMCAHRRV